MIESNGNCIDCGFKIGHIADTIEHYANTGHHRFDYLGYRLFIIKM